MLVANAYAVWFIRDLYISVYSRSSSLWFPTEHFSWKKKPTKVDINQSGLDFFLRLNVCFLFEWLFTVSRFTPDEMLAFRNIFHGNSCYLAIHEFCWYDNGVKTIVNRLIKCILSSISNGLYQWVLLTALKLILRKLVFWLSTISFHKYSRMSSFFLMHTFITTTFSRE